METLLKLKRFPDDTNFVYGELNLPNGETITILEDKQDIFPDGNYVIRLEYSPKFQKYLWEFYGINGRTEIKFHRGVKLSHTSGCPLVIRSDHYDILHSALSPGKTYTIKVETK
jgi:hypothetical protein